MGGDMAVKCVNCGLLALRNGHQVLEALDATRSSGTSSSSGFAVVNANLFCYAKSDAFDVPHLEPGRDQRSPRGPAHPIVQAINQDRDCALFMEWERGKSPKEHADAAQEARAKRESEQAAMKVAGRTEEKHSILLIVMALLAVVAGAISLISSGRLPFWK